MGDKAKPSRNSETMYDDVPQSFVRYHAGITPDDDNDLAVYARSLFIGGGGDLVVHNVRGEEVTYTNLPNAFVLPVMIRRVIATGTTATSIIGWFG